MHDSRFGLSELPSKVGVGALEDGKTLVKSFRSGARGVSLEKGKCSGVNSFDRRGEGEASGSYQLGAS